MLTLALALYDHSRTEAARLSGMDRQTLRDWEKRCNSEGVEGLKFRSSPDRVPVRSAARMAELRELVIQGPDPEVHGVERWQCADLRAELARRFEVGVHENVIGRWLHELGLTRLQPRPVQRQEDSEAGAAVKKTSLVWSKPRSKRPPRTVRWKSASRACPGLDPGTRLA